MKMKTKLRKKKRQRRKISNKSPKSTKEFFIESKTKGINLSSQETHEFKSSTKEMTRCSQNTSKEQLYLIGCKVLVIRKYLIKSGILLPKLRIELINSSKNQISLESNQINTAKSIFLLSQINLYSNNWKLTQW